MALWSEIDAMSTPRIRQYVGDRYTQSVKKGLSWIQETYKNDFPGWVPKPSRGWQTKSYPGLTAQMICTIELAQNQPEFKYIAGWETFKKAKEKFITGLNSIKKYTDIQDDQIEPVDQAVPPVVELEGSTFQVYPWALAACHMLAKDAAVSDSDRKMAASQEVRLRAMGSEFNEMLFGSSAETYRMAEALGCVFLGQ
jgi:hypothetical protein